MNPPVPIPVRREVDRRLFEEEILSSSAPVVMQGVVSDWPIVQAARESRAAVADFIKRLDAGRRPQLIEVPAREDGRIFYADDLSGLNFARAPASISALVDRLLELADAPRPASLFLEAMPTDVYLPGFAAAHRMPLLGEQVRPRLWLGNAVKVNTHFDLAYNIACVAAGRRRFTLFPPDCLADLYVAPLDFTPAGAPVSMVQLTRPDPARFPRFEQALRHAQQAELDPGDALYIPYGWWHHVESLTPFNALVNYWWNDAPALAAPQGALLHSVLAIRDLPADQRAVWAGIFQQLVFTDAESALGHLPTARRGFLSPPSAERDQKIRDLLAQELVRAGPGPQAAR